MTPERDSSTELEAGDEKPALPGCVVYVASGEPGDAGRHITLRKGSLVVGKAKECRLRLRDKLLSRRHLELMVTAEGIVAHDLDSTNGTRIDNQRIERAVLQPGARLRLGNTLLVLLPLARGDGLPPSDKERYGELLGRSLPMRRLFAVLERAESSEAPALITGETGSGKELVARAIHAHGLRRSAPFVVFDCAGVSPTLASDLLFGHARGAFTGASGERAGVFELADGGTLFIDELGELPLELQARLLRAVETGEVMRLGESEVRKVDVRIVAATHRDLARAVGEGRFREDLYFRLAVLEVDVPPLRERREDIPLLVAELIRRSNAKADSIPAAVIGKMLAHDWPGNVRELRNAIDRLLALGSAAAGSEPLPEPPEDGAVGRFRESRRRVLDDFERAYVEALMEEHGDNLSQAARASGLERHHLRNLLRKHGLYRDKS